MNNRIKQLAEQATLKWAEEVPGGVQEMEFFDKEKFAELIVKECLDIIEQDLETNKEKAKTDNEGRIWTNAQLTFSRVIRNRLGVEE